MKIGVDLMGGDTPPAQLLRLLKTSKTGFQIIPIGLPEFQDPSFEYVEAPEFIRMDEPPLSALKKKKKSSLLVGLHLLKEGRIDAFVSAGNTGALVSASKMILGVHRGILRPALLAAMPTKKDPVAVLDVGANVQIKAAHLVQFALLGSAYARAKGIKRPKVGLLNIGSEAMKGTSELRLAYQKLKHLRNAPFEFLGNIEGKSVFDGDVDVLVTDGFTGNIFLKTAEGIASLSIDLLKTLLPAEKMQTLTPQLRDLKRHLHYAEYPGAILAGVNGVVIKCHGYSTPEAFLNAVTGAANLVANQFIQHIHNQLDNSDFFPS